MATVPKINRPKTKIDIQYVGDPSKYGTVEIGRNGTDVNILIYRPTSEEPVEGTSTIDIIPDCVRFCDMDPADSRNIAGSRLIFDLAPVEDAYWEQFVDNDDAWIFKASSPNGKHIIIKVDPILRVPCLYMEIGGRDIAVPILHKVGNVFIPTMSEFAIPDDVDYGISEVVMPTINMIPVGMWRPEMIYIEK